MDLTQYELEISGALGRIEQKLDSQCKEINELRKGLYGPQGLELRVRKCEVEAVRMRTIWTVVAGGIGAVSAFIYDLFRR